MFAWLGDLLYTFFAVMGFICTATALIFLGLLLGSLQRDKPEEAQPLVDPEPLNAHQRDTQPRHDAVARRLLQDVSLDL